MRVEPLSPAHLRALVLQPHQALWRAQVSEAEIEALAHTGDGWTALDGERVLACLGVIDNGNGNGLGWGLLAGEIGAAMPGLTRAVRRYLQTTRFRRIEIKVAQNFPPARRWATMLGFCFEGVARAYLEDGTDAEHWSLVRL